MPLAASDQIQRIIRRDAIQPGGETRPRLVFVQLPISPQKGFLHHVLGVLFVSCHAKCKTENGAAMLLDQQSKRVAVARPRPLNLAAGFHFHPAFRLRLSVTVRVCGTGILACVGFDLFTPSSGTNCPLQSRRSVTSCPPAPLLTST